jgi:hypothetical protein
MMAIPYKGTRILAIRIGISRIRAIETHLLPANTSPNSFSRTGFVMN